MPADEILAKQIQDGDDNAYQELTRKYLGPIYNFLLRLTRNPQNAQDLTQETFIKTWRHIKKFDPEQNLKTWIFTIARRTAFDFFKKKRTYVFSDFEDESGTNIILETLEDTNPLPLAHAELEELRKNFSEKLASIPTHYREVLLLRYMEDLPFNEIASITGKPENTVKSLHRRGLARLREKFHAF